MCDYVCLLSRDAHRGQKTKSDPLQLELQSLVNFPTQMLETEVGLEDIKCS